MTLRYRSARRLTVVLQIIASLIALVLTIPCIIILIFLLWTPSRDFVPSDVFHAFRRFFFRIFSGHTLRPFILRTSLPAGPSIREDRDPNI
jgi:hypothetical protein